jgi:hypothetical protein
LENLVDQEDLVELVELVDLVMTETQVFMGNPFIMVQMDVLGRMPNSAQVDGHGKGHLLKVDNLVQMEQMESKVSKVKQEVEVKMDNLVNLDNLVKMETLVKMVVMVVIMVKMDN